MARITGSYNSENKDDLRAEVEARRVEGRNITVADDAIKSELAAALTADDASRSPAVPAAKHVPTKFTDANPNIPIAAATNIPIVRDEQPPVSDYKGVFVHKHDGEKYAQCIRLDDPRGKTHKMLNSVHFWEGTETEFRLTFEKE